MYCLAIDLRPGEDQGINKKSHERVLRCETAYQGNERNLFPLNGCRGFAANVVADPVDSLDFIDDAS